MAKSLPACTWKNGFAQPAKVAVWDDEAHHLTDTGDGPYYAKPPSQEPLTSAVHNSLGLSVLRTWPTLYNGTESPHGTPSWWNPSKHVDVLICGGGPFGLEVALSLARQGVSFRIVDKADAPLLAGRADAIQPRALELVHSWGLAQEIHEEGPILDHTAVYKDGTKMFYNRSSQCDSRYRGLHIITQGHLERIYIRDLLRHQVLVERRTVVGKFEVNHDLRTDYPVKITLRNLESGKEELVHAKYLVGSDGAASAIREQLKIPFDGNTTDIYWAIMDCVFKTDYPYITTFSVIVNSVHGGCIVVPREDGYTRIYTQISGERSKAFRQARQARANVSSVGETRIYDHGISPEEVLERTNKIFAPYAVEFASSMSWFAVWKVSERVARNFSSSDLRVHIGGDAAHVHSVMGAFGLNSSIYDAFNLGWKLGLSVQNFAKPALLSTYDEERRLFANRVIRCSGAYLRFICNSSLPLARLRGLTEDMETYEEDLPALNGSKQADREFLTAFFERNAKFLLGVECPIVPSMICPPSSETEEQRPTTVLNGARAPNPRVCFDADLTSYLYDKMTGASKFHVIIFGSDLRGPVRERIAAFAKQTLGPQGFFDRFGGSQRFNLVLVVKALPYEIEDLIRGNDGLESLRDKATMVYDDRAPDEDAHYWYGANHARGGVVVVRPDLWVGTSVWPEHSSRLDAYFGAFLIEQGAETNGINGKVVR